MALKISYKKNNNEIYNCTKTYTFGSGLTFLQWLEANNDATKIIVRGFINAKELESLDQPIYTNLSLLEEIDFSECASGFDYWNLTLLNCPNLKKYIFPKNIKTAATQFENMPNLTEVVFQSGLENMLCKFNETTPISINLPNSLLTIDADFFYNSQLQQTTLPDNCKIINIPNQPQDTITQIIAGPNNNYYKNINGSLYTKDGETLIHSILQQGNELSIAEGCKVVAPYSCCYRHINKIYFPKSIKFIEQFSFFMSDGFSEITLPPDVEYVSTVAFASPTLKTATITSPTPPQNSLDSTFFIGKKIEIKVPQKYLNRYKQHPNYRDNKISAI